MIAAAADNAALYALWVAAWASFAYGPQLVVCMLFAWSGWRRAGGDLLTALTVGFLWSLIPVVGMGATWWRWRRATREARAPASS